MSKNGHFWNLNFLGFFFQNWKTHMSKKIVIYVIDLDLNFVKDICVVGKKMARNGCKMAKRKSCQFFFRTDFTLLVWRIDQLHWSVTPPNSNDSTIMISKQTNHCQIGNLKFMKQTYCLLGCPSAGPKPIYNSTFVCLGLGYESYFGRSKDYGI